jgi:hypothetical protein
MRLSTPSAVIRDDQLVCGILNVVAKELRMHRRNLELLLHSWLHENLEGVLSLRILCHHRAHRLQFRSKITAIN